jgi:ATP-dependent RNA helicase DeaD
MHHPFNDLGITPPILRAIQEMGYTEPTPVQSKTIPHILAGKDAVVMSKTGSGKTAVFGIPLLQMTDPDSKEPQGLILTPTRELAVQVTQDLGDIARFLPHKTAVLYGQHSMSLEIANLLRGASVVTGTPGRVLDHLRQGNLITRSIRFLVLDEADRMLDMGFLPQVIKIIRSIPKNRVTLLFSATIPMDVRRISRDFMKDPLFIEIESPTMTVDTIRQVYFRVERSDKQNQLHRLLLSERPANCMIFCNTKIAVDMVCKYLTRKGYECFALHGDIPQTKRMRTIEQFKKNQFNLLVATDVAARGLHIENLSLVINYDIPQELDSYVHRIGRTGRAGKDGHAISLVTRDELMTLYEIEERIGMMIPEGTPPAEGDIDRREESTALWIRANALHTSTITPLLKKAPTQVMLQHHTAKSQKPKASFEPTEVKISNKEIESSNNVVGRVINKIFRSS